MIPMHRPAPFLVRAWIIWNSVAPGACPRRDGFSEGSDGIRKMISASVGLMQAVVLSLQPFAPAEGNLVQSGLICRTEFVVVTAAFSRDFLQPVAGGGFDRRGAAWAEVPVGEKS